MQAVGIDAAKLHIVQYGLLEELRRNALAVALLAEVAGEELARTVEDAQVDNVVVIHIFYVQTVVVDGVAHHFILRGVDGNIQMVTLAFEHYHRVLFQHFCQRQHLCTALLKDLVVLGGVVLHQFHQFAVGTLEPEDVFRLFLNMIAG